MHLLFTSMDPIFLFLLSSLFLHHPLLALTSSHITVVGAVYCDVCCNNTFSTHSYFLPGVDVNVQCKLKEKSPRTTDQQINLSVNRTTDRYGVYKLEIPYVDGLDCVEGPAIESLCKATLIATTSSSCSVQGLRTTSDEITVKSRQEDNLCIYSLSALSYRPPPFKRNLTLCGNQIQEIPTYLNSSKFFLPYFPPYGLFWPPLPQLPPLPPLPFPFPPLPQTPPPPFNLGDPRTWIPNFPFPPPPPFNLGNPRTWIPNFPILSPPPPSFNLGNPRTWIPFNPPTPPNLKQDP